MREVVERIAALLRQGQDDAALKLAENALAGVPFEPLPEPSGNGVPLELAFDPHEDRKRALDLPSFVIEDGSLMIDDEWWEFDDLPALTQHIQAEVGSGGGGPGVEEIVKRALLHGIAGGTIRKRSL